jgi:hypothetical protein
MQYQQVIAGQGKDKILAVPVQAGYFLADKSGTELDR